MMALFDSRRRTAGDAGTRYVVYEKGMSENGDTERDTEKKDVE
jgi:hypothetical protein